MSFLTFTLLILFTIATGQKVTEKVCGAQLLNWVKPQIKICLVYFFLKSFCLAFCCQNLLKTNKYI